MTTTSIYDQIISQLHRLTVHQQKQVLDFAVSLMDSEDSLPPGTPGNVLLKHVGAIPEDDLILMEEAIRECDTVNLDEW